jgi:signal transduction histidine kinase
VLPKTGDDFLPAVVEEIAVALDAVAVLVGEFTGTDHLETVAFWRDGLVADNIDYSLGGTPCAEVGGHSALCYPSGIQSRFPHDPRLPAWEADGFIGVPLVGSKGKSIGVLAAFTRRPIDDEEFAGSVLQLFAGRAAAMTQRTAAKRDLRTSTEHLLQVQRFEAIGRLAGNIAHDFNNLLMVVIGNGEILRARLGSCEEITELLAAADRAKALTRQLLAFGRRQVMRVQPIDMNQVVAEVQSMLTRLIGAQVDLTTSFDPDLPSVEADPRLIEQVLVNLAINAKDAMPGGGTLRISTSVENVADAYKQMPPGRYVTVTVADTGTGIELGVLPHIFEPYFTTKGLGGTGLGLSSAYGIIKQTGGYIWCHSQPGAGTAFKIYLRPGTGVSVPDARASAADPPVLVNGGTETILVVDDEPAVLKLMTKVLRGPGYHVIPAPDAKTAIGLLSAPNQHVDLVVSDVVMPGMSGTRLAEVIHERWPWIKVLFVSGYSQGVDLAPDSSARAVPLLGKPFTPTRLGAMVRDILDGVGVRRSPVQPE